MWIVAILAALLTCVLPIAPAAADKRVALVIGNSDYAAVSRLDNPINDANSIAAALQSVGFTLVEGRAHTNLRKADFDRVVQKFGADIAAADIALFFYAGHGVQIRGSNYLIPIDANPTRESDVDFQMLDVNLVLRQMESASTRLNLVILDACRNNPFGIRGLRAADGGLAQIQAPEGTLVSFATQPGNVALDGSEGNSPFSKALARIVRQSGLDLFQTFNEVGLAVKKETQGTQIPWVSASPISGSFYFNGGPGGSSGQIALQTPPLKPNPSSGNWEGAAAEASVVFGGPPYCNYKVAMKGIKLKVAISEDGVVTSASLTARMEETTVGNCMLGTIAAHVHSYFGSGSVTGDKLQLKLNAAARNQPQAQANFSGRISNGRLSGPLVLHRSDIGGNLAWTVRVELR